MAQISIGQQKILDRFKHLLGSKLELYPKSGRYSFFHDGKVVEVDQRPIEVMLRIGLLEKDNLGRCYPAADAPWNVVAAAEKKKADPIAVSA